MKKLFYSMMLVAAMFAASCNPEEETKVPEEPEYYGITLDHATVTNLGDFGKNGATQFFIQMYTLDEYNGYTRLMTAHFEVADKIEGDVIPEGTFTLMEGDYVDDSYFAGSWYMYLKGNTAPYTMVSDGEIKIEKTEEGCTFTVEADGWDYYTGDEAEKVECRYIGAIDKVENNRRYNPDWAGAVYYGDWSTQNGVPYWLLQLDDPAGYFMNMYVNTNNTSYEEGIPSGRYDIGDSMEPFSIDMSYPTTGDYWGGSVVYEVQADETLKTENIMIGGYMEVTNNGDGTYKFELVFYNGSYIPYVVTYEGELITWDEGEAPIYSKFAKLYYHGSNKWTVKIGDEEDDITTILYCYTEKGLEFADGLASGTYNLAEAGTPFEETEEGEPFTVAPGIAGKNEAGKDVYKGGSVFKNYSETGIMDVVSWGAMVVTNYGNNKYKFDLKLAGGLAYVYLEYVHDGDVDSIEDLSNAENTEASAPAKAAGFDRTPRRMTKESTFKYDKPYLR